MANGHGGARAGSGPKRGADGKALKPYKRRDTPAPATESSRTPVTDTKIEAKVVQEPPRPMFSDASVAMILDAARELQSKARNRKRTAEWNPYIIHPERIGPGHAIAKKAKMAMDDSSSLMTANNFACQSWQAGGMLSNAGSEGMMFLGYPLLANMLQRSEFRLFSEIMSEEMTRKWIDFRGTDDESTKEKDKPKDRNNDDEEADSRRKKTGESARSDDRNKEIERKIVELRDFCDEIKVKHWFKQVGYDDSGYGIGHLYLDLKGADINNQRDPENSQSIGNGRDEFSLAKLGQGCLKGLRTIEPVWCYPTTYNAQNPLSPDFYDPQVWYVMGTEIHKTRLLPFIGRTVSDLLKPAYAFGGLSMTQLAEPYVDIWLRTRESVGELIHAFSVMVFGTNLGTTTQPGGAGGASGDVIARMMLANILRDNQGMMVLGQGETYTNVSAPLGTLDELQAQSQEHMLSVSRIPAVKYTGLQPKGLNATSEGELRAFNDTVHGRQEILFRPNLTTVLDIAQISLWGARDPDITYDFSPLQEETPKERAEMRKLEAETDQIRIDSGVVSQEEAREKLAADEESGYHGIDPDDVPDLMGEEEMGLIPEGAGKGLEAELANQGGGGGNAQAPRKKPGAAPSKGGGEDELDEDVEDGGIQNFDGALDRGPKDPEHTVTIEYDGDFEMGGLLRSLQYLGSIGASRSVEVAADDPSIQDDMDEKGIRTKFGFDGDGADKIWSVKIDGVDVLKKKRGARDQALDAEWEESKHPRGQGGKFTSGAGGGGAKAKEKPGKTKAGGKPPASTTGGPNAAPQKPLEKLDWKNFKKTGDKKGSNPGGVYESPAGQKFYLKQPKGQAQVKNENAAARLYQLAGLNTFQYFDAGPNVVATEMENLDKDNMNQLSPEERKQAQKDFMTHAWLANWDAVGTGGDNIGIVDGKVKVLDVGGSLEYRAQGTAKGSMFGDKVIELDTMRDSEISPDAAALYGDMTQAQLVESAKQVTEIPDNAIREVVEAAGMPTSLADKLIARKKDIAATYQLKAAGATNPEWEALHPRGPGGKFSAKAGGEEETEKPSKIIMSEAELNKLISKKPIAGSNYRKALSDALKLKWISPEQKKKLAMNLVASWQKTQANSVEKGDQETANKIGAKIVDIVQKHDLDLFEVAAGIGAAAAPEKPAAPTSAPLAPVAKAEPPEPPKPTPKISELLPNLPKPTEAEIAKAKKNTPIKMQYIGGEKPTEGGEFGKVAQKMIDEFNAKYSGKDITDPDELAEKVNHFKVMQTGINGLAKGEAHNKATEAAAAQEKAKAEAAAKADAEAKKFAAEAKKNAERNKAFMDQLGISEKQAEGMQALAQMLGKHGKDLAAEFKAYENQTKKLGYPITGFQSALIKNYSDGGYQEINQSLRSGAWTPAQHAYVSMVNKALDAMPKHTGLCRRGTSLSTDQIAKYKAGYIIQEDSFMSTASSGSGFSGNVSFHVTAIGRRGASIQKLSNHPSENEVLFQARTFFKVNKVTKLPSGVTEIHMEEWEEH